MGKNLFKMFTQITKDSICKIEELIKKHMDKSGYPTMRAIDSRICIPQPPKLTWNKEAISGLVQKFEDYRALRVNSE